ncbi:DMT family transporter [Thiohalomonas denitrificans]|uniref:DMT family transporter n=1 Tax=Thiohalomonas denitrificans TaxID=415747 RepID=UPI0026E965A0|nr:DMT family transporter [Thiohalomonas denitrificans]
MLSAFALASADAVTKRFLYAYSSRELVLVRFGAAGLLLVPLAIMQPLPPVPPLFWGLVLLLIPLELAAMWLYMTAIRDAPLHLTVPYLAFTPVFNIGTGWLILGETVSMEGFAGVLLVVAGAWLLNVRRSNGFGLQAWLEPFRAIFRERGSRTMLGVALIYSVTSVVGKAAMGHGTPLSFGPFYFVVLGGVAVFLFAFPRPSRLSVLVRRPGIHLLVGLFIATMVVTHFLALDRIEVAYMVAVKRTSLLFGIAYGAIWFGERGLLRHLAAGSLMVAGVALILL